MLGVTVNRSLQVVALMASSGAVGPGRAAAADTQGAGGLAARLQPFVDSQTTAGVVTLSATRDTVLEVTAVGFADLATKTPMRADSLFWIASMSKPITGTALMMLVDEGKVNVDDPVEKYLPEFRGQWLTVETDKDHLLLRPPKHPITVRNILTHTSGLPFQSPMEQPTRDGLPLRDAVRSYAMTPLLFEPDSTYLYSNAGINTAGRIVEVISGMPYEQFLDQRLLGPLGMKDTTFWPNEEQLRRLATSYGPTPDKTGLVATKMGQLHYPLSDRSCRYPMPAGGLFSTAGDIGRFGQMILNQGTFAGRRYLSAAAVRQMTSKQTPEPLRDGYGLGWATGGGVYGHGGAFKTNLSIDSRLGLVTVFMVQQAGWRDDAVGNQVMPTFTQEAVKAVLAAVPAAPLPYLQGTTVLQDGFKAAAASLDGQAPATGTGPWQVRGDADNRIAVAEAGAIISTNGGTPGRGGVVASLPFTPAADTVYALFASYHFGQPVATDAWVASGFGPADPRKGPWMLVRPPPSAVAGGEAVGFTADDLRQASSTPVYAPLYPDITTAIVWNTRTHEVQYYLNNRLQGSLQAAPGPALDRVFIQGYQTGASVTVREIRLTAQPAP